MFPSRGPTRRGDGGSVANDDGSRWFIQRARSRAHLLEHPLGAFFDSGDCQEAVSSSSLSARRTGLEPAASGVTGRRYNQLNYRRKR